MEAEWRQVGRVIEAEPRPWVLNRIQGAYEDLTSHASSLAVPAVIAPAPAQVSCGQQGGGRPACAAQAQHPHP